jgi:metaxin
MDGSVSLYLHPPFKLEWQIPTVSPHCLAVDVYAKISHIPVTRIPTNNLGMSPTNEFPMLIVNEEGAICGLSEIFTKLADIGYPLAQDELLSDVERSDMLAFCALIEEKLYNCQLYDWWMQNDNYDNFTRLAFQNDYSFPLNILMKQQRKKAVLNHLDYIGYNSKEKVEKVAKEIYEALATKLGEKEFFFGESPTTLDCVVFGFLQTQSFKELTNSKLREILLSKKNLVAFCNNFINNWYFPQKGERKTDQMLKNKPLQDYTQKESASAMAAKKSQSDLELKSAAIILTAIAVLFVYVSVDSSNKS